MGSQEEAEKMAKLTQSLTPSLSPYYINENSENYEKSSKKKRNNSIEIEYHIEERNDEEENEKKENKYDDSEIISTVFSDLIEEEEIVEENDKKDEKFKENEEGVDDSLDETEDDVEFDENGEIKKESGSEKFFERNTIDSYSMEADLQELNELQKNLKRHEEM